MLSAIDTQPFFRPVMPDTVPFASPSPAPAFTPLPEAGRIAPSSAPVSGLDPQAATQECLRLLGVVLPAGALQGLPAPALRRVAAGATLMHEGADVEAVYIVRTGGFKAVRVWDDGYEHVLGLAARGDLIGFDSLHRRHHLCGAVALEDSTVYALRVRDLDALRLGCPGFGSAVERALSRQLAHAAQTAEALVAVGAETRLARFLVAHADHMAERGESPRRLHLRMARRDLASLLGVAHETISRCFSNLAAAGVLQVDNRDIEILDRQALLAAARTTRNGVHDLPQRAAA